MKNERTTLRELVTREQFIDWFNGLEFGTRYEIARTYAEETNGEEIPYDFDEDFFNVYFNGNPMEAARATFFGNIQNWADPYIRFNVYGNLETMKEWEVEEWCELMAEYLYDDEKPDEVLSYCDIDVDDIAAEVAEEATAEA